MIHHEIVGTSGPWLVLVHGVTASARDWRLQTEALSPRYRCLTLDLRGHGQSAAMPGPYDIETLAADVVALLRHLSVDDAVLIGHSMGTRVVAAAALQAPEKVAGLVFVDGSRQGEGDPLAARDGVLAAIGQGQQAEDFIGAMFEMMFTAATSAAEREQVMQRTRAMPLATFRELFGNMVAWDAGRMPAVLQQLTIPLAVVQSTQVTPQRERVSLQPGDTTPYLDMLRANVAHMTVQVVPDVGHFTQIEAAAAVNALIDELAGSLPRR